MVNGLEIFRMYFKDFTDNYILIGGAACEELMSESGLKFRATKDLDLILIVESLTPEFVRKFWEFVKLGNYENKQKSQGERKFYRFLKPEHSHYPAQLELFARKPDFLDLPDESHLTPIPVSDEISSLSAILMNNDYYNLTIKYCQIENDLCLASASTLICLKARAFLDLTKRQSEEESISEKEIRKHKYDAMRLASLLRENTILELPDSILTDMRAFISAVIADPPDFKVIGESIGLKNLDGDRIIKQIKQTFSL